jgi:hypothetical protein
MWQVQSPDFKSQYHERKEEGRGREGKGGEERKMREEHR